MHLREGDTWWLFRSESGERQGLHMAPTFWLNSWESFIELQNTGRKVSLGRRITSYVLTLMQDLQKKMGCTSLVSLSS